MDEIAELKEEVKTLKTKLLSYESNIDKNLIESQKDTLETVQYHIEQTLY